MDSLDTIEMIMELEEEFDEDSIRWVLRFIKALSERSDGIRRSKPGTRPGDPDPPCDRHLDG
jgi:hypothetical protein